MAGTDFLHGVEVVDVDDGSRVISTVKSAIIGLLGTAGMGDINVPTLVTSFRQAVLKFGPWDDRDGFTIPEALDAIYDQTTQDAGAQVIVVNIAGKAEHRTAVAAESTTFSTITNKAPLAHRFVSSLVFTAAISAPYRVLGDLKITLPKGCTVKSVKKEDGSAVAAGDITIDANTATLDNDAAKAGDFVTVAYEADLVAGVDYTVSTVTGILTRVIGTGGKLISGATVTLGYEYVDASKVVDADWIGGVDPDNGQYLGVHALTASKSTLAISPRIVIAPHATHTKPDAYTRNGLVAELEGVLSKLKAIAFIDGPNTTDEAAVMYRQDWDNPRLMICDPWVRVEAPSGAIVDQPASSRWAGVKCVVDQTMGFWVSPSNKQIKGIVGISRPVEFSLGDPSTRSNYLNGNQVSCIINEQGYRTWGNRTTTSSDTRYAFLNVQVVDDMVAESIMLAHLWAVDRNITKTFVSSIVENVNTYLRYLKRLGAIIDGKAWADPDLNTPDVIKNGQVFIDYDFTPPYPAERITFRKHLVDGYLTEIFDQNGITAAA
jgi:phage tail sheath protein FI